MNCLYELGSKYLYFFLLAVTLVQPSCKNNPVDVASRPPREYTWRIEKISSSAIDQTLMWDMYAVDSKNIWIVGHNSGAFGQMYHYDGSSWSRQNLIFGVAFDLQAIAGFAKDNIWAVGVKWPQGSPPSGFIIHYDGNKWVELTEEGDNALQCVWGSGPNDIWFGGLAGTLLHFDGSSVKPDSVPRDIPRTTSWGFYAGASRSVDDGFALLVGEPLTNHVAWSYSFRRQTGKWMFMDSSAGFINRLWYSPWGKLYRTGAGIGYLSPSGWVYLNLYGFTRGVYGLAEDDMFAVGTSVWHWNGSDWYEFTNLPSVAMTCYKVWTDGREVFIIGIGSSDDFTYVLHGS